MGFPEEQAAWPFGEPKKAHSLCQSSCLCHQESHQCPAAGNAAQAPPLWRTWPPQWPGIWEMHACHAERLFVLHSCSHSLSGVSTAAVHRDCAGNQKFSAWLQHQAGQKGKSEWDWAVSVLFRAHIQNLRARKSGELFCSRNASQQETENDFLIKTAGYHPLCDQIGPSIERMACHLMVILNIAPFISVLGEFMGHLWGTESSKVRVERVPTLWLYF